MMKNNLLLSLLLSLFIQLSYTQTYSEDNLSLYLDKKHQSIDTNTICQPKTNNIMYQVTILKYEKDKFFEVQLIAMDHASNRLKLHTYAGFENSLYNDLLKLCTTIYGNNPDNWLGTIDEEIFVVRQGISRFESDIKYIINDKQPLAVSYWEVTMKGPMYHGTTRIKANASVEDHVLKTKIQAGTQITETVAKAIYLIKK